MSQHEKFPKYMWRVGFEPTTLNIEHQAQWSYLFVLFLHALSGPFFTISLKTTCGISQAKLLKWKT